MTHPRWTLNLKVDEQYNEEHFLDDITWRNGRIGRRLAEYNLDLDALRKLVQYDKDKPYNRETMLRVKTKKGNTLTWYSWLDLLDIHHFGETSMLWLVNYIRNAGIELQWFKQFDEYSREWRSLEGRPRTPAVKEDTDGPAMG